MDKKLESKITSADLPSINSALAMDNRVEIVPTKTGVRIRRIECHEIKKTCLK